MNFGGLAMVLPLRHRVGGFHRAVAKSPIHSLASLLRAVQPRPARERSAAHRELARRWDESPTIIRLILATGAAEVGQLVDNLSAEASPDSQGIACFLAASRPTPIAVDALARALDVTEPGARRELCRALARLAADASPNLPWWDAFDRLIAHAAERYDRNRLPATLGALLSLARHPGPLVRSVLTDPNQHAHLALRGALRKARFTGARAAAVACLAYDPLASAALDRLAQTDSPEEHDAALRAWHLLINPARRRRLARATSALLPPADALDALSDEARLGLVKWTGALPMPANERRSRLLCLASDPELRVSVAAERALARLSAAPPSAMRDRLDLREPTALREAIARRVIPARRDRALQPA